MYVLIEIMIHSLALLVTVQISTTKTYQHLLITANLNVISLKFLTSRNNQEPDAIK